MRPINEDKELVVAAMNEDDWDLVWMCIRIARKMLEVAPEIAGQESVTGVDRLHQIERFIANIK